jgi:hypothetical protein
MSKQVNLCPYDHPNSYSEYVSKAPAGPRWFVYDLSKASKRAAGYIGTIDEIFTIYCDCDWEYLRMLLPSAISEQKWRGSFIIIRQISGNVYINYLDGEEEALDFWDKIKIPCARMLFKLK